MVVKDAVAHLVASIASMPTIDADILIFTCPSCPAYPETAVWLSRVARRAVSVAIDGCSAYAASVTLPKPLLICELCKSQCQGYIVVL
mmetsp:Transcript_3503/g.12863  ORF Transcript_3503/g.12863 Transcript_3503/m.12863 type:complete len:88 (+) Transcript_3503:236-499(+)